jgi:hypothetical protein
MHPRFDFSCDEVIQPRDSHVTDADEQKRLSGQTAALIARLRRGPAARADLAKLAPNITARVSDARAHLRPKGESVEVIERNRKTGYTLYAIVDWAEWQAQQAAKALETVAATGHIDCDCADCRPWTT